MANFTGTSGSEEFAGDEFSNNLFSDLAPLLTLFGEQVTKQFLSMSMGWADNVLLAMGPLGIMTIVVSAIRVGRVKMLKAMVGRARESQSDAEQELLSSTSEDVCELWSGHEVVRVMGQPAGMKTLIISDKKVYDIKSAMERAILERIDIDNENLESLTNAAPNLTLNIRDATAGPRELWTWAAVGVILQVIAIAIPGIATYVWQWPKADVKVQNYGYPCFVIGTLLVVLGTMVCGHVIEGVTTEHNFTMRRLSDVDPRRRGVPQEKMQVVRLQRACTVSDQHFSSYAIFNDEDNHSIRTSRLNTADYGTLAAVSSLVSVVGFIIQFVGLRALHWSATIIQLGITIIMTGIRAWARRGLAFDPETHVILDGHEIAWLVLHLVSKDRENCRSSSEDVPENHDAPKNQDVLEAASNSQALGTIAELASTPRIQDFWNISFDETLQKAKEFIWEPIVGYDSYRYEGINSLSDSKVTSASDLAAVIGFVREDIYMFQQLFLPLRLHDVIGVELTDQPMSDQKEDDALNLYKHIAKVMPADNTVMDAANSLASVMERTMNILCDVNATDWKKGGIMIRQTDAENDLIPGLQEQGDKVSEVFWGFTISMRMPYEEQAQTKRLYFRMVRVVDDPNALGLRTGPTRWQLQDRELIVGILSLWLYSMARRRISIEKFDEPIAKRSGGDGYHVTFRKFGRIVGTGSVRWGQDIHHPLSSWLGVPISEMPLPDGSNSISNFQDQAQPDATWFLGMFLSSMAQGNVDPIIPGQDTTHETGGNLYVLTRDDSSLEIQFAQELLSLFILAMANNIGKVLGKTVYDERRHHMAQELRQPAIYLENSVFNAIANEVVNGGLAHDTREAHSIIIPAFYKLNILPKPEETEEFS